jgi:hypothetical protein
MPHIIWEENCFQRRGNFRLRFTYFYELCFLCFSRTPGVLCRCVHANQEIKTANSRLCLRDVFQITILKITYVGTSWPQIKYEELDHQSLIGLHAYSV